ncbi:hypothetical protein C0989_011769 [Termitomyces sp. Mn162]|nr:hypothetical protein C0989_011769 [Termitomyces sp. Mn162]
MTQPTSPAPPSNASSPQDNSWSCLLSLETQVQLTQASLTSHTAKLTGLYQTTEAVSLSLQALLEHLPLASTPPPGPPAAAARFFSAPSSEVPASHSKLPCPALPDVFDGDGRVGECFLQSCITYIQLSSEAFASDALKIAWILSYMKASQASTYVLCILQYPGGVESFSSWMEFEKELQAEFFSPLTLPKLQLFSFETEPSIVKGSGHLMSTLTPFVP